MNSASDMGSLADRLARAIPGVCQEQIDALLDAHAGINGALVSTIDGFEIAYRMRGTPSTARLAAMSSSLVALAQAIGAESNVGACRDVAIDANAGRILLMDIPSGADKLLLTVLCDDTATLGQVLWAARDCRDAIAARLGIS